MCMVLKILTQYPLRAFQVHLPVQPDLNYPRPYVLHGVENIDPVSLACFPGPIHGRAALQGQGQSIANYLTWVLRPVLCVGYIYRPSTNTRIQRGARQVGHTLTWVLHRVFCMVKDIDPVSLMTHDATPRPANLKVYHPSLFF